MCERLKTYGTKTNSMVPHRNEPKKKGVYATFGRFVLDTLEANPDKIFTARGISKEYERAKGEKLTQRAVQKAIKKLAPQIQIERKEQLYIKCSMVRPSKAPKNTPLYHRNALQNEQSAQRIHSTHKIKLSIGYAGTQPLQGADIIKPWGRYGTEKQAVFKYETLTIVAFKYRLHVWVHNPKGKRTEEQLDFAKRQGTTALLHFAERYNLKLRLHPGGDLRLLKAHSVVESPELNSTISPTVKQHAKEIYGTLGTKICETSHKGKVEHEGTVRPDRVIQGTDVAKGLEWLTLDFKQEFNRSERLMEAYMGSLELYDEQIRKHLTAIETMAVLMEEIRNFIKCRGELP